MSELIDREALKDAVRRYAGEPIKVKDKKCQAICLDMLGIIDALPSASPWHRVEEPPENNDAVNVVWVNRNPESYYADIKDKPFVATAHYHNGKWYWFSATCKDYLDEYGRCEVDDVDEDIDILYWMPLPSPPVNKMFTK